MITDPTPGLALLFGSDVTLFDEYFNRVPVEILISERPVGFDGSDIEVSHGTGGMFVGLITMQKIVDFSLINFNVHYEDNVSGEATVSVPAGGFTDAASNPNTASNVLHIAQNRTVSIADASAEEGPNATIDFQVTLDAANDCETATVDWATSNGTATAGDDYAAANGTLTFQPGETTKTVSVAIVDDDVEDGGETFTVRLSNASGVEIADAEATGTIQNTESPEQSAPNTPATGAPTISGTAKVGQTLTASISGIEDEDGLDNTTFSYQWIANDENGDSDIQDAADVTYRLRADDEGKSIKVRVTFTDDGETEEMLTSEPTVAVKAEATEPHDRPHGLEASAARGTVTLTWQDPDTHENSNYYHILRHRPELGEAEPLIHARYTHITDRTFVDSSVEPGVLYVYAVKAVTDLFGSLGPASASVQVRVPAEMAESNHPATGAPTISGTAQVGQTLTASVSGIDDEDGLENATFSYQWIANDGNADTEIADATRSSYTLSADDLGKNIKVRVDFADDAKHQESLTSQSVGPVDQQTSQQQTNSPATGRPTITGTAKVGETLTASVSGITDPDGLLTATFAYQWIRNKGSTDEDIRDATNATYILVDADEGKTIKVRVTFDDDGGTEETLTSAATEAVVLPLTATFEGVPAEHDGSSIFTFRLRFSEDFKLSYKVLRDHGAFDVTGGTVKRARRVNGRNDLREIHIQPSGNGDVTITLVGGRTCGTHGAICTADGKVLSSTLTATVKGPAALSVADARAEEGTDATIDFAVNLSRAASGTVTVDYATANGTATAGQDYTATEGTLTFTEGETSKTVSVPVLDDNIDEGEETFTIRLSNASGARIEDGEATGTITNSDPLQKMWLSRFGRTVASHVVDAVSERLAGGLSGSQVTVGGQTVDLSGSSDETGLEEMHSRTFAAKSRAAEIDPGNRDTWPAANGGFVTDPPAGGGAMFQTLTGQELLLGSSFHLTSDGDGSGPALAAWGRVTVGGFDAEAPSERGEVRLDGEVTTGILGADAEWGRMLAGVSVSVSEGEGTFDQPGVDRGTVESSLTGVHPYLRMALNDRVSAWGLLGYGTGDMTMTQAASENRGEIVTRTDIEMRLGAAGARGVLVPANESGGLNLALRGDAFLVEMESEKAANTVATTADASRLRLILESSWGFETGGGGLLTPGVDLGLRHDGGDAETGTGFEVGASLSYADPVSGLSIEASARTLVAHEASGFEEWGASGSVRLDPGASGRGLSLSIAPSVGATSSGLERLWSANDAAELAGYGEFDAQQRVDAEVGYGLVGPSGLGVVTPYAGLGLASGDGQSWRAGARWQLAPTVSLGLEGTRVEAANDDVPMHGVVLRGSVSW